MAYGTRVLGSRSSHSSRGSNDPPGPAGKPLTGRRGTGNRKERRCSVRAMRTAETILTLIRERGQRGLPLEKVYRLLYQRDLYLRAYGKLYRNAGALTEGTTTETVDGMSV